jgi:hypothetical protein
MNAVPAAITATPQPSGVANPMVIAAVTTLVALGLRLTHVLTTARAIVMGDSIGFEIHARNFLRTWQALGSADFVPRLLDTIDNASLQGVVYPAVQSIVYLAIGEVKSDPLLVCQAVLGAATVGITALTAWRVAGPVAGWFAGITLAIYGPHILTAGTLTAEAVLISFQTVAIWCIVETICRPTSAIARIAITGTVGGVLLGITILRPALQFTAVILGAGAVAGMALETLASRMRVFVPYADAVTDHHRRRGRGIAIASVAIGVLMIAGPWWLTNAIAFGQPTWSRTGNSWQQVYWGIYPPNRAWQPQDAPVPPKYGVESLPEARNAGIRVDVRDLDYLDAAFDQVRATPVQAFATMVDKLAGAWLYPWDPFNEEAPFVTPLVPIVHRLLLGGMVLGLGTIWRRPVVGAILVGALLATWLPYLAVNIDVRYVVTPAPLNAIVAGIAMADLVVAAQAWRASARRTGVATVPRRVVWGAVATCAIVSTLAEIGPTGILMAVPTGVISASAAHLVTGGASTLIVGAAMAIAVGVTLGRPEPGAAHLSVRGAADVGILAGATLAVLVGTRIWFAPYWHEWAIDLRPGDRASQSVTLPAGWRTPPESVVELRLWLQGGRAPRYEPVVRVNGTIVANFRPAFDDAGSLRFPESTLAYARLQGKVRADLPQWYAVRLDPSVLDAGRLDIDLEASPVIASTTGRSADAWIRVWGDFPSARPRTAWDAIDPTATETYEGPALFSRRAGADHSVFKYYATGDTLIWRRTPLRGTTAHPTIARGDGTTSTIVDATRLREGTLRMRVVVLDATYALIAAF